ncbi:aminodeoxychorismate lyase [Pseudomonas sp. JS3066]|uniref:aminodeoxychorismate lyase n=1 Tax=unclassified Pseudomonas TaxID=196821 RepID=UPI000EAA4EA5|nr:MULTISPECIES: aminodeoxychorismate lyase [unclassified Pseudomonas]AYF86073.1 aminodeoxychorismate lyase [Pseudomonas sp. DY-1]MDH4651454.1 aminodeoxychorismate lyase [Pseudomonas sp. BN606]MRK19720.1 aminodeoxychorismate lyase [Pseudomonas sp. JG-B]WVK91339.1 aminodeoxychorismate lyase [Pseudomonas sp. JS3066]
MPNWVDGHPAESLSIKDRGLAYGDGLFETIAVRGGRPPLLEYHMARLADGCRRLRIPLDLQLMRTELMTFSAGLGEGVAKLIVTRGEGLRGYAPPPVALPRRILQSAAFPAYPAGNAEQGVRLFPCATRLAEQPLLAGLKHLNRLEQVLARAEWQDAQHAEGLMRDLSGRVIEGVFSNLFMVRKGALVTADLSRCGVAGVMRAALLDSAKAEGLQAEVRDVDYDEFLQADEVFLCNSLFGIWPVRSVTAHHWPVGPLTRKLQAIARDLLDI